MKNKKVFIIGVIVLLIIAIITCILVFNNNSEKEILYCHKERTQSGITQFMGYRIIRIKDGIKIKQENKMILNDSAYNLLVSKGYSTEFLNIYFENSMIKELDSQLKKHKDFITYKFITKPKNYSVDVEYVVNSKSQKVLYDMFKFDFFNSKIKDMVSYFESGEMVCEEK